MRARAALVAALVAGGCGKHPPVYTPATVKTVDPASCATTLRVKFEIETRGEPAACVPLYEAVASLSPEILERVRGLSLVREHRGPCGDKCTGIAATLLSDAALAYYDTARHALVITDAGMTDARWRGGTPPEDDVRAYLAALGLTWSQLVARVRALPGAALPATDEMLAVGDVRVFDAIVKRGPAVLLGGAVSLRELFRHELGHVATMHEAQSFFVDSWKELANWRDRDRGTMYPSERPIVASRLALGLPRGDDTIYLAPERGPATGYAKFDPMEDFAEAVRLAYSDPIAVGTAGPARLLVASAGRVSLRDPQLRRFIAPGVAELLAPGVNPTYAIATIRAHGDALLPEALPFADERPLELPADLDEETRALIPIEKYTVRIGGHQFRPTDAVWARFVADARRVTEDLREVNRP